MSSVDYYKDIMPSCNVSWYYTIDKSGLITQHYKHTNFFWHAGLSHYKTKKGTLLKNFNKLSIGIEMINGGELIKINESTYIGNDYLKI